MSLPAHAIVANRLVGARHTLLFSRMADEAISRYQLRPGRYSRPISLQVDSPTPQFSCAARQCGVYDEELITSRRRFVEHVSTKRRKHSTITQADATAWADRQLEAIYARDHLFVDEDLRSANGTLIARAEHMNGIMRGLLAQWDADTLRRGRR